MISHADSALGFTTVSSINAYLDLSLSPVVQANAGLVQK